MTVSRMLNIALMALTLLITALVVAACGESRLLPQAKICVETASYSLAVDSVSEFIEPLGFKRRLDTREAETVRDVRPRFVYWRENGGVRVAVDDYSERGFAGINVYDNAPEFSDHGVAFFDSLTDHLRAAFGDAKVKVETPPRNFGRNPISTCGR